MGYDTHVSPIAERFIAISFSFSLVSKEPNPDKSGSVWIHSPREGKRERAREIRKVSVWVFANNLRMIEFSIGEDQSDDLVFIDVINLYVWERDVVCVVCRRSVREIVREGGRGGGGERRERFRECVLRRFQIQSRSTSSRYSSDGKEACGNLVFLNFGALSSIF